MEMPCGERLQIFLQTLNVTRISDWLNGKPRERTRIACTVAA
jgi:hypothetical protein